MGEAENKQSFWEHVPNVSKAMAGLITAIAALIGALVALGVVGPNSGASAPESTVASTTVTTTAPPVTAAPSTVAPTTAVPGTTGAPTTFVAVEQDRSAVLLSYSGDDWGCSLFLTVVLGDQVVEPIANPFFVDGVLTGEQGYEVNGSISCPPGTPVAGTCDASGTGLIDVFEGREIGIGWMLQSFGGCTVELF